MPPVGGGEGDKLKWVCHKIGKKYIDNICLTKSLRLKNKKKIFLAEMEKVGGKKGVCGRGWECGKPVRFSIISMPRSEGEKGR